MKKKILGILIVLVLLISATVSLSAAETDYDIWVGGVRVTEANAKDVLGDGTVSYDAATNTLTLSGADITECHTTDMFVSGVYSEIADLTVKLLGENRITVPIEGMPDGSDMAICSVKSIEISGTGKLSTNTYAVASIQDVVIKECEISSEWYCASAMGNVTADGATLSGKVGLISSGNGDITLKNTTVPDGGNYIGMYTEIGDITIEGCNVTIHGAAVEGDGTVPIVIGEGGGTLTVKDSVLDLKGSSQAILSPVGGGVFENVEGKFEVMGDIAYAMLFGGTVSMKECDLEISCRATEDAACGIFSTNDINIADSKLKIDVRTADEAAVCIGGIESPNTNVDIWNSTLELKASGPYAVGFYANNVKLNQSVTNVEATANVGGNGFAAGIAASEGKARVNGGVLEVLATGPVVQEGTATVGILMGNAVLAPEFIEADVKLRGNQAICTYPDLTLYGREYELIASTDVSGESKVEFTKETVASVRYLHIHPFYSIYFDANGGTGEMSEVSNHYGTYSLPQNTFTPPAGKIFKGWALSPDGEVLTVDSLTPHADTDLYAIWEDDVTAPDVSTPEGTDPEGTDPEGDDPDTDAHTHAYGNEWRSDGKSHWKECTCGDKTLVSAHADSNNNGGCDICGASVKDGPGVGAIVGIVIGSFAVLGLGGFALLWFVIKKKSFSDLIAVFKK